MAVQVDEKKLKEASFQEIYAMRQWVNDMNNQEKDPRWPELLSLIDVELEAKLFEVFYYRDV